MNSTTVGKPETGLIAKKAIQHTHFYSAMQGLAMLVLVIFSLEYIFALAAIGEDEFLKPDPVFGVAPIPNKHVTKKGEAFAQAQYNRYGLPDPELPLTKPANTFRIVVLGDSFVEALQVERKEKFCYLLQEALNKKNPKMHFEVMNFGVAAYSLGQMYLRLKNLAFQFQPDMVLLAVRSDTTYTLQPSPAVDLASARPSFFLDKNNQLIIDYTVYKQWLRTPAGKRMQVTGWLREHSRIWGVFSQAVEQMTAWYKSMEAGTGWGTAVTKKQTAFAPAAPAAAPSKQGSAGPKMFLCGDVAVGPKAFSEAKNKGLQYFWPTAEAILLAMSKECSAHKCKFLITSMPGAGGQLNPLETSMFKQSAQRLNIPFADVSGAFAKFPTAEEFYAIHLTPFGHKLVSKEILPFVWQNMTEQPDLEQVH